MKGSSYLPKLREPVTDASGRWYDAALRHLVAGAAAAHPDPLSAEVLLTLLGAARTVSDHLETTMEHRGLSMARFAVLLRLWRTAHHSAPMHELATWCHVSPRNITGLVDGLQNAGLVSRTSDPADRRVTLIRLTVEGSALIEEAAAALAVQEADLAGELDEGERRQLIDLCVRLTRRTPLVAMDDPLTVFSSEPEAVGQHNG